MSYVGPHMLKGTQHNVKEEKEDEEKLENLKFCENTLRRTVVESDSDLHRS